jgi:hypothetical protein
MFTDGAQCTANFVFKDKKGRVYVGYAAHCAGLGSSTDTNGCEVDSHPYGTRVRFGTGANILFGGETVGYGRLVYSSWRSMRARGVTSDNQCNYNDFALVRVEKPYRTLVNPSLPGWGGPTGVDTDGIADGAAVYSYGSSSLRLGPTTKEGTVDFTEGGGWSHVVRTSSAGVPGDSGAGYVDAQGRAVGTLSTLGIGLGGITNGVGDFGKEFRYAQRHSGIAGLRLAKGTKAFSVS